MNLAQDNIYTNDRSPDFPHFGDTEAFTKHVRFGTGTAFLPPALSALSSTAAIGEISLQNAADVAVGMIEAAIKTSESVPELRSIGGAIDGYRLTASGIEKFR